MLPSQEHPSDSKKHGVESFTRNLFSSSRRVSSSSVHGLPPTANYNIPSQKNGVKSFIRKLFPSNSRVSSSRNLSAQDSLPNDRPDDTTSRGSDIPHLLDPPSPTVQATGTASPDNIRLEPASASDVPFSTPDGISLAVPDHGQPPTTKRPLTLLWHGFEQLLKRIEPFLDGTPAKAPISVLNTIIDIGKAVVDNQSSLAGRVAQTMNRLNVVNNALLQEPDGAAEEAIRAFAEKLINEAIVLKGMSSSPIWERIIENQEDAKQIEESFMRLDEYTKDFQLEIVLRIERNTSDLSEGVNRLQLENLPCAHEALYNASLGDLAREPCTPGTRVSILDGIYQWAQDSSSNSPQVFWLTGDAGSGKSTIAYTVAEHFDDKTKSDTRNILGANFFCSRQFEKTRRREYIIPTIVYQLARQSRSYARALLGAKFSSAHVLSDQVKDLLVDPWRQSANKRPSELPPYLVIIDALDEVDGQGGPAFLRELLMTVDEGQLQGLKFLITSRPHHELATLCATFSTDAVCRLYDVPMDTVKADILEYLKVKLPNLQDEPQLTDLAEKADGLFIFASTVVRYIRPRDRMGKREQLSLMHKLSGHTWPISSMASLVDKLYQQILQEAFSGLDKDLLDTRLSILHTFLCTVERVSPSVAATLISDAEMEDIARFIVDDLHAVLYVNEGCVFWYHASFQDFIFSKTRSKFTLAGHEVDMSCDAAAHNAVLAHRCFQIMVSKLRFNICNLPSSFLLDSEVPELKELVHKNIDNDLKYCSQYWSQHLAQAGANDRDNLRNCVQDFLVIHVLFWIEAMNLLGLRFGCSSILQQAREWVLKNDECPSDLSQDILEAANFATYFTTSQAAQSTPHIYISSLATWSRDSAMSQTWKQHFSRVPSFTITKSGNNVALMTIPIGLMTNCVAISTDGTCIVSGSANGSVRMWDASTGVELKTLYGHTDYVQSIAFSKDGTRIVSGSKDKTVRVWDASTGVELKTLSGHTNYVQSVAVSGDDSRIASGSDDRSVRVWDASTGVELKTLYGHTGLVQSIAFSNDGTHIVSGSKDKTIRVWDVLTGVELKILFGHTGRASSVAFSSDGTRIVSSSTDKTVRVWDASAGVELKTLNGHTGHVRSVAISSDGTRIVSGSDDKSVRVWDASTGAQLKTLNGHTGRILSVAFSSDSTRITSGSDDNSVRVWDASTGVELKMLNGHTDYVRTVAISSDDTRIVSGSDDESVRVWDAVTGVELKILNGHTHYVWSVAISSDGTRIVSGSDDNRVRVWDALTGVELMTLNGHTGDVSSVAFSCDGTRIVSGSDDNSVRVWNVSTGVELKTLNGHTDYVRTVAISSDGTRIVSGSDDKSVRVWDASTGVELKILNGHTGDVSSVAFSSDATRIVSGSKDETVRVWDASTGVELKILNGHTDYVHSVAFSKDDTHIVSGSKDKTVRLWDASTGVELKILNGHAGDVSSVAFSTDGTRIASGSYDQSVRVWVLEDDDRHWLLTPQNWIVSLRGQDRLMWVSQEIHDILHHRHSVLIISRNGSATVDFRHSKIGTEWAECYTVV